MKHQWVAQPLHQILGADAVAEEIKAAGGEVHVYKCDLSSREQIYAAAELVKKVWSSL